MPSRSRNASRRCSTRPRRRHFSLATAGYSPRVRAIFCPPGVEPLRRLGGIERAPPVRADGALHRLAARRRLELNAGRALLPVIWLLLVFDGIMRQFRLCE